MDRGKISIVSWNIRGIGVEVMVARVRRIIRKTRANFYFIQESKIEVISKDLVRRFWHEDNFEFSFMVAYGKSGG